MYALNLANFNRLSGFWADSICQAHGYRIYFYNPTFIVITVNYKYALRSHSLSISIAHSSIYLIFIDINPKTVCLIGLSVCFSNHLFRSSNSLRRASLALYFIPSNHLIHIWAKSTYCIYALAFQFETCNCCENVPILYVYCINTVHYQTFDVQTKNRINQRMYLF